MSALVGRAFAVLLFSAIAIGGKSSGARGPCKCRNPWELSGNF